MGRNNREKTQKAKKRSKRPVGQKSRSAVGAAKKSATKAARQLDKVVQQFEGAVEKLRETLPDIVDNEVRRDRLRLIKSLADDGILDSLQRLATALEDCGVTGGLPESLVPLHRSARMAFHHLCRTFEVQAVHQPGESLAVTHEQVEDFDWSADHSGELNFPADVEILRSGWKAGDTVFVLPKVRVRQPARQSTTST